MFARRLTVDRGANHGTYITRTKPAAGSKQPKKNLCHWNIVQLKPETFRTYGFVEHAWPISF